MPMKWYGDEKYVSVGMDVHHSKETGASTVGIHTRIHGPKPL